MNLGGFPYAARLINSSLAHSQYLDGTYNTVLVRDKQTEYYQVSASVLDETTLERELRPLNQIKDNYPKFLITLDDFMDDHGGIKQLNLIEWLQKERV